MSWVFENSEATGNDRLVLLAIADRCDDDGGNCWKSTETLAKKARVSKRTAQRCIDHLVELGELHVVERVGLTSVLSVLMGGRQVVTPPVVELPIGGVKLTPRQVDTRDSRVARGGDTRDARYILEPSKTPQPPASGGRRSTKHCDKHTRFRRDCDNCIATVADAKRKPPYCGNPICDPDTRLIADPDSPVAFRCPECHPLRDEHRRSA